MWMWSESHVICRWVTNLTCSYTDVDGLSHTFYSIIISLITLISHLTRRKCTIKCFFSSLSLSLSPSLTWNLSLISFVHFIVSISSPYYFFFTIIINNNNKTKNDKCKLSNVVSERMVSEVEQALNNDQVQHKRKLKWKLCPTTTTTIIIMMMMMMMMVKKKKGYIYKTMK